MDRPLTRQLEELRTAAARRTPPERAATMDRHIAHLAASGLADRSLKVGDRAPAIVLPDARGGTVDVSGMLPRGPVVVVFYRGGWCPYCNLELKAYQAALPRLRASGASLVAISPERPDLAATTAEKDALEFPVLSDVGSGVGRSFGIVYEFTEELKSVYAGFGRDMSEVNGTPGVFSLPLTATYVIGHDGVIQYAEAGVDYRYRSDPADVLAVLERGRRLSENHSWRRERRLSPDSGTSRTI